MDVQLFVNNIKADTDQATAIGVTFNGFDFSDAGRIHLTYSNNFTLPITNRNRAIFGVVDNMGVNSASVDSKLYGNFICKLYVDGALILSGKIYVSEVSGGRIGVYMLNNKDFTETMSGFSMYDATVLVVNKLNTDILSAYPSGATFANIIGYMSTGTEKAWLPYATGTLLKQYPYSKTDGDGVTCGNLYDDTDNADDKEQYNIDNETTITTEYITDSRVVGDYKAGHIYVNLYTVLSTVFDYFGFSVNIDADVLTDMQKQFIRMPDVVLYKNLITGYYSFRADNLYKCKIGGEAGAASAKLSFLDLFKMVCNEYCMVFDVDTHAVNLHSFADIKTITPKTYQNSAVEKRSFILEGLSQNNYVRYEKSGDGNEYAGAMQVVCSNLNISADKTDIVSIKRYICGYLEYLYEGTDYVSQQTLSLNTSDSSVNDSFVMIRKDESQTPFEVSVRRYLNGEKTETSVKLYKAVQSVVQNSGWWDLFAANCLNPESIEAEVFIKPYEILNFKAFNLAKFSTIQGLWYITSITGWNPKLNGTVKVTAVRIR